MTQLKDIYSKDFLLDFSKKVQSKYDKFNIDEFISEVMDDTWNDLVLRKRMYQISEKLGSFLPEQYEDALDILFTIADDCEGFPYLFFPEFVVIYGMDEIHWELSMKALEYFTQKSSSEFAIRSFLLRDPTRVMKQMTLWANHPNEHVRRLASEGCRPRLPWGESLPIFKKDPLPVLSVLELLKEDSSLYVRKSVANNLNDIAKDNPDMVLETAHRWIGNHKHTDWIIRHGCRTLIRKASPAAMALFGYERDTLNIRIASISIQPDTLAIGETSQIQYHVSLLQDKPVHIRIEYGIDFVKANGKTSRKSFLLSDKTVSGNADVDGTRTHDWSDLTTRRHYPGNHRIVLLVNGIEAAETMLHLFSPIISAP